MPADVKKLAEERRDGIKSGKLHPFSGPLKDQSGKEFLAAGKTYTDADLLKMNFTFRVSRAAFRSNTPRAVPETRPSGRVFR